MRKPQETWTPSGPGPRHANVDTALSHVIEMSADAFTLAEAGRFAEALEAVEEASGHLGRMREAIRQAATRASATS